MSKDATAKQFSFKRNKRLITPSDYQFVFKNSLRSSDRLLTVIARKSDNKQTRLGLAISKKAIKTAVHRNRVKRLTREFFRLNFSKIATADYIVMAKKGIDQQQNSEIRESLAKQFNYLRKKFK